MRITTEMFVTDISYLDKAAAKEAREADRLIETRQPRPPSRPSTPSPPPSSQPPSPHSQNDSSTNKHCSRIFQIWKICLTLCCNTML